MWDRGRTAQGVLGFGFFCSAMALSHDAVACGGLFCSQSAPVNQAAERIVFAQDGDTTTAVIEIRYDGPSEAFSWVLPVPGIPEVGLGSSFALDQLQAATNPVYQLNTRNEDCDSGGVFFGASEAEDLSSGAVFVSDSSGPAVQVVAGARLGPYDYEVLEVDEGRTNPAGLVLDWLSDNGYDISALGEELLADYLAQGLNLIAFRLNKDADTGSIRPVRLTYGASNPVIPIRPTAVAANPDMGVIVWVLGKHRAIPHNYLSLELNEMLIDWFNPGNNYEQVVSLAADDAGGQGFVTEMSDETARLSGATYDDAPHQATMREALSGIASYQRLLSTGRLPFLTWDGFTDVVARTVPTFEDGAGEPVVGCLPCMLEILPDIELGQVELMPPPAANFSIETQVCDDEEAPSCVPLMATDGRPVWDPERFLEEFEKLVIEPARAIQELLDSHDTFTRMFTTLSPDEMTVDPQFEFNPDLGPVSNLHVRERRVGCNDNWEVRFEGGRVSGDITVWPVELSALPSNQRILQLGTSGEGMLLEDNTEAIRRSAARLPQFEVTSDGCGCRVGEGSSKGLPFAMFLALLLVSRRRPRASAR